MLRACVVVPLLCTFALVVLLCLLLCHFACGLPHSTHLVVHGGPLCLGKYTYSPLRIQCDRCQGEVTRGRLPWLPPLFTFCPHLLINCCAVNWHLPSILNIAAYRQVKDRYIFVLTAAGIDTTEAENRNGESVSQFKVFIW